MVAATAWWPELAGAWENFQVMCMLITWVMVVFSQVYLCQNLGSFTFYFVKFVGCPFTSKSYLSDYDWLLTGKMKLVEFFFLTTIKW